MTGPVATYIRLGVTEPVATYTRLGVTGPVATYTRLGVTGPVAMYIRLRVRAGWCTVVIFDLQFRSDDHDCVFVHYAIPRPTKEFPVEMALCRL